MKNLNLQTGNTPFYSYKKHPETEPMPGTHGCHLATPYSDSPRSRQKIQVINRSTNVVAPYGQAPLIKPRQESKAKVDAAIRDLNSRLLAQSIINGMRIQENQRPEADPLDGDQAYYSTPKSKRTGKNPRSNWKAQITHWC